MSFNMIRSMVITFIAIIFIGVIVNIVFDAWAGGGIFPTTHVQGTVAQIIPEYNEDNHGGTNYLVQMAGSDGRTYNTVYYYRINLPLVGQKVDIEYITSTNYFVRNHVVDVRQIP